MPRGMRGRGGGRRGRGRKGGGSNVDRDIVRGLRVAGSNDLITVKNDLTTRPLGGIITQSPPKNIRSKIYWMQVSQKLFSAIAISNSIETYGAFSFQLSDVANYTFYSNIFDDYCLYAVDATICINGTTTNAAGITGELCTAIDFDSAVAPGSYNELAEYATAQQCKMNYGRCVTRFIKPCNTGAMYSGTFTSYNVGRYWVDCNSPSVQHYGLKCAFTGNNVSSLTYDLIATYIFGFRNTI